MENELIYRQLLIIEHWTGIKMNKGKKDGELLSVLLHLLYENDKLKSRLDELEGKM